jgi:hypothetical protein
LAHRLSHGVGELAASDLDRSQQRAPPRHGRGLAGRSG